MRCPWATEKNVIYTELTSPLRKQYSTATTKPWKIKRTAVTELELQFQLLNLEEISERKSGSLLLPLGLCSVHSYVLLILLPSEESHVKYYLERSKSQLKKQLDFHRAATRIFGEESKDDIVNPEEWDEEKCGLGKSPESRNKGETWCRRGRRSPEELT